jgi:D-2-hydroxyacid dehydrogenase (NADP+)
MIVSAVNLGDEYAARIERETGDRLLDFDGLKAASEKLPEAEIVIAWGNFSSDHLELCRRLKLLFIFSAGVERLPFEELVHRGVTVANVSGIHGPQMAEQAFGMMIAFSRRLKSCLENQREKKWGNPGPVGELTGKALTIIGAGSIGLEFARKARAFDMDVTGLKRSARALPNFDRVWEMDRLHEALGGSDYIVLLTPLTAETRHLIGAGEFEAMKPGSVFINMSRGDVVDEAAMIEALRRGKPAFAGLDVFKTEPLPAESPLWEMDNVIITPHNAGHSPHYTERAVGMFIDTYFRYRQGMPLENEVDPARGY